MPNWVKNRITLLNGENVEEVLKDVLSEQEGELYFDFDKLIPMPKSLNIESSSSYNDYFKVYLNTQVDDQETFNKLIELVLKHSYFDKPKDYVLSEEKINKIYEKSDLSKEEVLKIGKQITDNLLQYGSMNWYDWCNENWGCKWNASDCEIYGNVIEFATPWDIPKPIMNKFFEKFTNLDIEWEFSEEQISVYGGYVKQINEKKFEIRYKEDSKEMYELAFDLWGCEDMYRYNEDTGTYEYFDED